MKHLLFGALVVITAAAASIVPANAFYVPGFAAVAPVEAVPVRLVCDDWGGRCWRTYPRYVVPPPVIYPGYGFQRPYRPYGWHRPYRHRW
ncbi:hypothetical protein ACVIGB_001027 [Bradyrhizobium sp. USDA 4341]